MKAEKETTKKFGNTEAIINDEALEEFRKVLVGKTIRVTHDRTFAGIKSAQGKREGKIIDVTRITFRDLNIWTKKDGDDKPDCLAFINYNDVYKLVGDGKFQMVIDNRETVELFKKFGKDVPTDVTISTMEII